MNLPNKLTVTRIIMIPIFVALFYLPVIPFNYVLSAVVFALASITDFLDGKIARKYNLVTNFGKFLDPIADKVLVSTALIVLLCPIEDVSLYPFGLNWCACIFVAVILARELIVSGFRLVASGSGKVIAADKSGKFKTFFTDLTILVLLIACQFSEKWLSIVGFCLLAISTLLTIYSGIEMFVKNADVLKEKK